MSITAEYLTGKANRTEGIVLTRDEGIELVASCRSKLKFVCCNTKKRLAASIQSLEGEVNQNKSDVRIPPANYPIIIEVMKMGARK